MIETTIQELTAAIRDLTAALNKNPGANSVPVLPVKELVSPPSTKRRAAPVAVSEPVAETVVVPEPVAPEVKPDLPPPGTDAEFKRGSVTQADLRDVAQKLLRHKALPEILRINKEHDIRRITECPEEKYEAVYEALTAALANATKS